MPGKCEKSGMPSAIRIDHLRGAGDHFVAGAAPGQTSSQPIVATNENQECPASTRGLTGCQLCSSPS
jgi:hypothetical protein